jgi:predicted ATPase
VIDPAAGGDLLTLARNDAVALFMARARALKADFELTEDNARAIAGICARVDGLPLAIELAAARIVALSPQRLFERLDRRLKLLTGGPRDADERQRTLRSTIDWSHGLLGAEDRTVFARAAVFAGGFTLDGAEAVCDAGAQLDVLDRLQSLVEKSLLREQPDTGGDIRFSMLETIREYAGERLEERPEAERTRAAHAQYFLGLAESAEPRLRGAGQLEALAALDAEHDNLQAALGWALADDAEPGRRELGVRLAGALGRAWYLRADGREGRAWLERARAAGGSAAGRAKVLYALGVLADQGGDPQRATSLLEESLELLRRASGDRVGIAQALHSLGVVARNRGDGCRAQDLLSESLELRRQLDDRAGVSATTCCLGLIAAEAGDLDQARALFEESLALDRALDDRDGIATNAVNLGYVALEQGDVDHARALLGEGLRAFEELSDQEGVVECLEEIARLSAERARPTAAVRLLAAAGALREAIDVPLTRPADHARIERRLAGLQEALGPHLFAQACSQGRELNREQAVAEALLETEA